MELVLERVHRNVSNTEGNLHMNGEWFCNTLEDVVRAEPGKWTKTIKKYAKTAIPYGRYPVMVTWSNKFNRMLTGVFNVPNFEGLRFHFGTSETATAGCILVSIKDDDKKHRLVDDKKLAMNQLCEIIQKAQAKEKIWLTIIDRY